MNEQGPNDINDENGEENIPIENNEEQPPQEGEEHEENMELDDEGENGMGNEDIEGGDIGNGNDGEDHPSGSGNSISDPNNPPHQDNNHGVDEGVDGPQQSHESESDSQRVENESIYSYDENKDFPVFANKINKKQNEIISNYKKALRQLTQDIEEDKEMLKILKEHTASVESQVKNREKMVDEMTKNANTQAHTIEVIKRQIGKVKSQRKYLENEELTFQGRFNTVQQYIAKANEKMEKLVVILLVIN